MHIFIMTTQNINTLCQIKGKRHFSSQGRILDFVFLNRHDNHPFLSRKTQNGVGFQTDVAPRWWRFIQNGVGFEPRYALKQGG